MNIDAQEAALGLLGLSPSNVLPPSLVPLKRKQASILDPSPSEDTSNDSIRCICGFTYDDGFSIACDDCSRWCHAACFDIVEGGVPEEWRCWECVPRVVDRERAVRLQRARQRQLEERGEGERNRRRMSPGVERRHRRASAAAIEGSNSKRKRRASIIQPNEDELVDIDEPWTLSYVPISTDIVPLQDTRDKLRRQAQHWRGITAVSPYDPNAPALVSPDMPVPKTTLQPLPHSSVRPPSYAVHTTSPIPSAQLITPYTSTITPSSAYLSDPLNAYAHLGMPKPFVHLMGPPLDLTLDSRLTGDKGRFVRSGCRPNAVLRPVLCPPHHTTLSFGVFALRDLKANEEVVLGWEWDDGNAIHSLPALISTPHMFPDTASSHSPDELQHLRHQLSNILHALSSTFTTCACGSRAKDCALTQMAAFVDAEDGPSSPPLEKVDLGPLVGSRRGFRTRERVPYSGGMSGVEMDDEASRRRREKGKDRATEEDEACRDRQDVRSSLQDTHGHQDTYGQQNSPKDRVTDGDEDIRPSLQSNRGLQISRNHVKGKVRAMEEDEASCDDKDTRPSLQDDRGLQNSQNRVKFANLNDASNAMLLHSHSPPPGQLRPPDPMQIDDLGGEKAEEEDKMPPKMRKKWIHREQEVLREMNGRSSESESPGASGSPGGSTISLGSSSVGGGSPGAARDDVNEMPPPPMPASIDPTTVFSLKRRKREKEQRRVGRKSSGVPSLLSKTPRVAMSQDSSPSSTPAPPPPPPPPPLSHVDEDDGRKQAATSPSISFAKLSLISPVVGARGTSYFPSVPMEATVSEELRMEVDETTPIPRAEENSMDVDSHTQHAPPSPQMDVLPLSETSTSKSSAILTLDESEEPVMRYKATGRLSLADLSNSAPLPPRVATIVTSLISSPQPPITVPPMTSAPSTTISPPPQPPPRLSSPTPAAAAPVAASLHSSPHLAPPSTTSTASQTSPIPSTVQLSPLDTPLMLQPASDVRPPSLSPQPPTAQPLPPEPIEQKQLPTVQPQPQPQPQAVEVNEPPPQLSLPDDMEQERPSLKEGGQEANGPPVAPSPPPQPQQPQKVKMSLKDFALRKRRRREEEVGDGGTRGVSVGASPVMGELALGEGRVEDERPEREKMEDGEKAEVEKAEEKRDVATETVTQPQAQDGDVKLAPAIDDSVPGKGVEDVEMKGISELRDSTAGKGAEELPVEINPVIEKMAVDEEVVRGAVEVVKEDVVERVTAERRKDKVEVGETSKKKEDPVVHGNDARSVVRANDPPHDSTQSPSAVATPQPSSTPQPSPAVTLVKSSSPTRSPSLPPDSKGARPPPSSTTLQTKKELVEQVVPNGISTAAAPPRRSPHPQPPRPPPTTASIPNGHIHQLPRRPSTPPPHPSRSHSRRPSQEDGEIPSNTSDTPPPQSLKDRIYPSSRSFVPRSHTPPTQPRSFQVSSSASSPSPSTSAPARRPSLPPYRSPAPSHFQGASASGLGPRPLPSGPRALRGVNQQPAPAPVLHPQPPAYTPPSRSFSGSQYIPRGPSADRDRADWDRDRSWQPSWGSSQRTARGSGWGR